MEPQTSSMQVKVDGDETVYRHESFGMLQLSKASVSGDGSPMFGSSLKHRQIMTLRIQRAAKHRHLNRDWYMSEGPILIEAEMSMSQFADAITSLNTSGTPITLTYVNSKRLEDCPEENIKETFRNEMASGIDKQRGEIEQLLQEAQRTLKRPGTLKKDEKEALLSLLYKIGNQASNSMFTLRQFEEHMENVLVDAKTELNAYANHIVETKGLDGIKKALDEPKTPPLAE